MPQIRADISKYQPYSSDFMKSLRQDLEVNFISIQLTYGLYKQYINPKAPLQIINGLKYFNEVGAYHFYLGNPVEEANHFLRLVNYYGLDKTTELMIDVEENITENITEDINVFLEILYNNGFNNLAVYYNEYCGLNFINYENLIHNPKIWVAKYSTYPPKCYYDIWQYTDSGKTQFCNVDLSIQNTNS